MEQSTRNTELILFSGNSNRALAERIASLLKISLAPATVGQFSDGETRVELEANIRGKDVFIFQSMCAPQNHNFMEAMIMVDACRRASAQRITLVAPYFAYARQERKSAPRTPITAKLVADIITTAGVDRVLTMELHTGAIQGFFNIPVDHLFAKPIYVNNFVPEAKQIIVSPDAGGVERARGLAKHYGVGLAIVDKRRDSPNESNVMHIIGEVEGKHCLIVDDICDTAGSLVKACDALLAQGAASVSAAICHPIFSGPAIERIRSSNLSKVLVTDTIPLKQEAFQCGKVVQFSVAELFSQAIERIHHSDSISSLFI